MRSLVTRMVLAVALVFAPLALASCGTPDPGGGSGVGVVAGYTPAQNLYRAHATYNIVLGGAVTYAESSFASPTVVKQMTEVNRRAKPAFEYAEAVIACAGPDNSGSLVIKVANARCSVLDISPATIQKNAGYLDWAKKSLLGLLGR